jgi:hypothetical protein
MNSPTLLDIIFLDSVLHRTKIRFVDVSIFFYFSVFSNTANAIWREHNYRAIVRKHRLTTQTDLPPASMNKADDGTSYQLFVKYFFLHFHPLASAFTNFCVVVLHKLSRVDNLLDFLK